jgi:hypothetical protein
MASRFVASTTYEAALPAFQERSLVVIRLVYVLHFDTILSIEGKYQ